jgi:hypothetical protein
MGMGDEKREKERKKEDRFWRNNSLIIKYDLSNSFA